MKVDNCNYTTVQQLISDQHTMSLAIQAVARPMVIQMGSFVFPLAYDPHLNLDLFHLTSDPQLAPWVWVVRGYTYNSLTIHLKV